MYRNKNWKYFGTLEKLQIDLLSKEDVESLFEVLEGTEEYIGFAKEAIKVDLDRFYNSVFISKLSNESKDKIFISALNKIVSSKRVSESLKLVQYLRRVPDNVRTLTLEEGNGWDKELLYIWDKTFTDPIIYGFYMRYPFNWTDTYKSLGFFE